MVACLYHRTMYLKVLRKILVKEVEAMVKQLAISALFFIISGCDTFSGPVVRSEFAEEIVVDISYESGRNVSITWSPCQEIFVGEMNKKEFEDPNRISHISIVKESKLIYTLTEEEIKVLYLSKKERRASHVWVLSPSGVSLTDEKCKIQT